MEGSLKVRAFGSFSCCIIIGVYILEIQQEVRAWLSFDSIAEITICDQVYGIELWLFIQSIIWVISLTFMLLSFLKPNYTKFLICFMYFVGPVFFVWTCFAIFAQVSFISCCQEARDKCKEFYPYKNWKNFYLLLGASFILSISISVVLIGLLAGTLIQRIRNTKNLYQNI